MRRSWISTDSNPIQNPIQPTLIQSNCQTWLFPIEFDCFPDLKRIWTDSCQCGQLRLFSSLGGFWLACYKYWFWIERESTVVVHHPATSHHSRTQPVSKNSLPPRCCCCCSLRLHSTGFWCPSIHLHTDRTQQHLLWNWFGSFPKFRFLKLVNLQKENLPSQHWTKLDRFLGSLLSSERSENKIVPSDWHSTAVNFQLSWKISQATLFDMIQLF